jgi:hypothetical protein
MPVSAPTREDIQELRATRRHFELLACTAPGYMERRGGDGETHVKIEMRTHGLPFARELQALVERRLEFALDRWGERVARTRVALGDENGPKGGTDKTCRVEVRLRGGRTLSATARHADVNTAIGIAVHRVARGVARAFERERAVARELLRMAHALWIPSTEPIPSR